jgi:hypothetical protein
MAGEGFLKEVTIETCKKGRSWPWDDLWEEGSRQRGK